MGIPFRRAASSGGMSSGTPGLMTISSASRNRSAVWPPDSQGMPSLSSSERSGALPESVANTDFPRLCRSFAAATPLRAIPTINTISSGLPQFQGRKTEQCKDQRHDPEADDDFRFRPSSQFEVMVYRRHSENPLAAQLERQYLDHHRQSFDDEHPTDKHQQQF